MEVFKSDQGKAAVYESYDKLIKSWDVPITQVELETSYGKTHVILAGDKKDQPLILFHGVGDNSAIMWINNVKQLAQHYYFIAVDTIGGAGKSCPDHRYGKGFELTTWFKDILQALKIEKTNLVGVSYGCYLSQLFLITCPDKVDKVVGIAGYPNAQGYKMGLMKRMLTLFLPVMLFPTEKNIDKVFRKLAGPNAGLIKKDSELYRHWRLLLKHYNNGALRFHKRVAFSAEDYSGIKARLIFLIGEFDELACFPEALRAIKDLDLQSRILKDTAHTANYDKAQEVNAAIIGFFE